MKSLKPGPDCPDFCGPEDRCHTKALEGDVKFVSLIALFLAGVPAFADVFTLDSEFRGWITSTDVGDGTSSANNYYAGIDASFNNGEELRNWFEFDLSSVTGTVTSATLELASGTYLSSQPSETFQLTSLPSSFGFADLGTGTFYASQVYSSLDNSTTVAIALDAAAITDINAGGTFGMGGRLTSLVESIPGSQNEAIFDQISGFPSQAQLIVNTSGTGPVAPEPASLLLFATGLAAVQALRRARQ
jgi:hypothetical protein